MSTDLIRHIRLSSRNLVRALGFMRPSLAGTSYPPSCVHALIQLGEENALTVVQLARALDLDKSTASRVARKLLDAGEVHMKSSAKDAREKLLSLTSKGRSTLEEINRFGDRQVNGALARIPLEQHKDVAEALSAYAQALSPKNLSNAAHKGQVIAGYRPGILGRIVELHAAYYSKAAGFGSRFEASVAAGLSDFVSRIDNPANGIWTVTCDGEVIGSVAIDGEDLGDNSAHLRWFILHESCRGQGLGKELLETALYHCREREFREVVLWTFSGLNAAQRLYTRAGFELIEEHDGAQWGEIVREQKYVLAL